MSEDSPLPDDDGAPKYWCYTTAEHPTFVRVADYPITRDAAIKRLRDRQPADLSGVTHVTLARQNSVYDPDEMHIEPVGQVRIRYTEQEQTNRMLASAFGDGFTINMPGKAR